MSGPHPTPACPHTELAIGWALHALEPAEQYLVAPHLADCPECTRTVAETEQVGAALGLALSDVAIPSPRLEWRVLAATETAQAWPVTPPPLPTASAAPDLRQTETDGHQEAASALWSLPGRARRWQPLCVPHTVLLIGVALLALVAATVIVYYLVP